MGTVLFCSFAATFILAVLIVRKNPRRSPRSRAAPLSLEERNILIDRICCAPQAIDREEALDEYLARMSQADLLEIVGRAIDFEDGEMIDRVFSQVDLEVPGRVSAIVLSCAVGSIGSPLARHKAEQKILLLTGDARNRVITDLIQFSRYGYFPKQNRAKASEIFEKMLGLRSHLTLCRD